MTWEIFLGIVALVGFFISISTPLMKLNTSITKLQESVSVLQAAINKIDEENYESFKRIWEHNGEQDEQLCRHEKRLDNIERTMNFNEKMHPELVGIHDIKPDF